MADLFKSGGGSAPAYPVADISNIAKEGTNATVGMAWGSEAARIAEALENRKSWQSSGTGVDGKRYDPYKKVWVSEKEYRKQIRDLSQRLETIAQPLIPGIAKLGDKLIKDVDKLVADGKKELNQEEKDLLGRLQRHEQKLTKFQDSEDASLLKDLGTLNDDLKRGMDLLNAEDKAAFQQELTSFEADAAKLTQEYDTRATDETERGFTEGQQTLADYEARRTQNIADTERREFSETDRFAADSEALAKDYRDETKSLADTFRRESLTETDRRDTEGRETIGRFETDRKSLADTYLSMVDGSASDYQKVLEQARDLSPERLNIFTQAADYLSNAAVQTRMNLLAAADPRALELSAIADENAAAMMSGRISSDVQANLARSSAMRALGGGFGAGSQMGRGLAARDLGLTSVDLMRQGAELNDAQRRLNYATRVEGTQVDSAGLLAQDQNLMRQGAADMLNAATDRNRTFFSVGQQGLIERQRAELDQLNKVSDARGNVFAGLFNAGRQDAQGVYDKRQASRNLVLGSNLATIRYGAERTDNTLNTALAGNLANIDTRTGRNLGIAKDVFNTGLETNRYGFTAEQANRDNRTTREANTLTNVWDRNFQARTGIYNTNIGTARSIYGTNANAVGNIYSTNANAITNNLGIQANTRGNVFGNDVRARLAGFETLYDAKSREVATRADALQKNWAAENARYASNVSSSNALWGNLIQTGASIAGAAVGAAAGNPLAGYQVGNTLGSVANSAVSGQQGGGGGGGGGLFGSMGNFISALGGRNTSGFDGQWGMYGKPDAGWGNFDYGSGTGA